MKPYRRFLLFMLLSLPLTGELHGCCGNLRGWACGYASPDGTTMRDAYGTYPQQSAYNPGVR